MKKQGERYHLIDGLRGLALVNMVLFHFLYDANVIFGRDPFWYDRTFTRIWQQGICWTFILISGFSWPWGKKNAFKRGLLFNACGLLVTVVTLVFVPDSAVWFGILNFLGCAALILIPLDRPLKNIPPALGIGINALLFLLFYHVEEGWLGLGSFRLLSLPGVLYDLRVLTPLGFPFPGFYSSDYFPVLPWIFLFICGYFLHPVFEAHPSWKVAARTSIPVLSGLGKYSLLIYLAHQPVCMALCMLLFG